MDPSPSPRWNTPQPDTYAGRYAQVTAAPPYQVERPPWNQPNYIPRKPIPLPQVKPASISSSLSDEDTSLNEQGERLPRDSLFFLACSILCTLTPCVGIALGIATLRLDGQIFSDWGSKVQNVILLIPTVYPVLFAALMSKSLRAIALGLVSRGTTLGRLEQLIGSGTVGGTIVTAFSLRLFNITTIGLIAFWSLAPLGGQASLRMLTTKDLISERIPTTIWYRSSESEIFLSGTNAYVRSRGYTDPIYVAALSARNDLRDRPLDMYKMLKIPWIEALDSSKAIDDDWIPVEPGQKEAYSSLLGVPWQVVRHDGHQTTEFEIPQGKASFSLESSYFRFDCDQPRELDRDQVPPHLIKNLMAMGKMSKDNPYGIGEWKNMHLNTTEEDILSGRDRSKAAAKRRRRVEFVSRSNSYRVNYAICTENQVYVESMVTCIDGDCGVTHMRPTRLPTPPPEQSAFDGGGSVVPETVFLAISQAGIYGMSSAQPTPTEGYIRFPDYSHHATDWVGSSPSMSGLSKEDFSRRFSTAFNTYYSILLNEDETTGIYLNLSQFEPPMDVDALSHQYIGPTRSIATRRRMSYFRARRTEIDFVITKPHYAIKRGWFVCFMGSCVFLAIFSFLGLFLQILRESPDIFWTSGLIRDSRYFILSGKSDLSTLDGDDKTRRLRDMRVIVADVDPHARLGRIALVAMDEKTYTWRKLSSTRRYC